MEVTIAVCGSKVHALRKLLNPELAEHVLGFAIGEAILHEAPPDIFPDFCRKSRGAAQVDCSDIRVRFAWNFCMRARRVQMERKLARDLAYLESYPR